MANNYLKTRLTNDRTTSDKWFTRHFVGKSMYFQNTWKSFATTCLRVSYKSLKTGQNALICDNLKNGQSVHFKTRLTHDRTTSDKWFTRHFVGKSMYFQNTWKLFATTCLRVSYKSLKKGQNALICDNLENRQSVHFKTRLTHGRTNDLSDIL